MTEYKRIFFNKEGVLEERLPPIESPKSTIIISKPKTGKTMLFANSPKVIIADCDPGGGSSYMKINNVVNISAHLGIEDFVNVGGTFIPMGLAELIGDLTKANNMKEYNSLTKLWELAPSKENKEKLQKCIANMKFPILVIDTLTHFTYMIYQAALLEYKNLYTNSKTAQSKTDIRRVDDYGGVQHIRRTYTNIKHFIETHAAPCIVYTGHVKNKTRVLKKTGDEISVADLDLEGSLGTIFTSAADAVGTCYRDEEGLWFDFQKKYDDDQDARPIHLANKLIKVSDIHTFNEDGTITKGKTYLEKIFPDILV